MLYVSISSETSINFYIAVDAYRHKYANDGLWSHKTHQRKNKSARGAGGGGGGLGGGVKWEGGRLANSYQSTHCTLLQRRLTHFRRTSTYRRLLGSKKREAIDVKDEREAREKTPADRRRHGERETGAQERREAGRVDPTARGQKRPCKKSQHGSYSIPESGRTKSKQPRTACWPTDCDLSSASAVVLTAVVSIVCRQSSGPVVGETTFWQRRRLTSTHVTKIGSGFFLQPVEVAQVK